GEPLREEKDLVAGAAARHRERPLRRRREGTDRRLEVGPEARRPVLPVAGRDPVPRLLGDPRIIARSGLEGGAASRVRHARGSIGEQKRGFTAEWYPVRYTTHY